MRHDQTSPGDRTLPHSLGFYTVGCHEKKKEAKKDTPPQERGLRLSSLSSFSLPLSHPRQQR